MKSVKPSSSDLFLVAAVETLSKDVLEPLLGRVACELLRDQREHDLFNLRLVVALAKERAVGRMTAQ